MRHLVLALAATVALSTSAVAEPIELTMQQARELFVGLTSLNTYPYIVKDGERETAIQMPYKFSVGTSLALEKNIEALKPLVQQFDQVQRKLLAQLSGGTGKIADGVPEQLQFVEQREELLNQKQTVDLVKVKTSDLGMDPPKSNPISPAILAGLRPIRSE